MRVLVCGGRDFADRQRLYRYLHFIDRHKGPIRVLIHGAALGADQLAADWARDTAFDKSGEVLAFPAEWDKDGRAAGPIRNARMLAEGKPDLVIAFPRANGKIGPGTADMVRKARAAGLKVIEVSK